MKVISILLLLISSLAPQSKKATSNESIRVETDKIYSELVVLRRDFHANPELAGNESRTQEVIKRYLIDLGLEVKTNVYGYGVVGVLRGEKRGKTVAWRADMDAMSTDFPDEEEFKSTMKGVQHGCGHDVHMAIALGIAEVLSKHKRNLKGTVYFIFQPEEETFLGAKRMVDQGLFSEIRPTEIYGLHVTDLPVGKIMTKSNEVFAHQRKLRIEMKSDLSKGEAKVLTQNIQNLLARSKNNSMPWEIQHISDTEKGLMNSNTIFNDYLIVDRFNTYSKNEKLVLEAYLYETDVTAIEDIVPKVKKLIENGKHKEELISVSFTQANPTVMNDEKLTNAAISVLQGLSRDLVLPAYGQVPYFNDDFVYFQQQVPGVYFFLGGSNVDKGIVAMNHSPNFKVDEECIRVGVSSFSSMLMKILHN
ncbi:MAG: amidohydrolase [Pedobacter sp.]|nr:MAG: amidohydrolase [Pedobacter sp.]